MTRVHPRVRLTRSIYMCWPSAASAFGQAFALRRPALPLPAAREKGKAEGGPVGGWGGEYDREPIIDGYTARALSDRVFYPIAVFYVNFPSGKDESTTSFV